MSYPFQDIQVTLIFKDYRMIKSGLEVERLELWTTCRIALSRDSTAFGKHFCLDLFLCLACSFYVPLHIAEFFMQSTNACIYRPVSSDTNVRIRSIKESKTDSCTHWIERPIAAIPCTHRDNSVHVWHLLLTFIHAMCWRKRCRCIDCKVNG